MSEQNFDRPITGHELIDWPEWKALASRLGLDQRRQWEYITIRIPVGAEKRMVLIDEEFIAGEKA